LDKKDIGRYSLCDCGSIEYSCDRCPGQRHAYLYRQHVVGYGFLFATPWAWLLDPVFRNVHNREAWFAYAIFLWIPAMLYSVYLWMLLVGLEQAFRRTPLMPAEK
jgi:hypothetical protein